MAGVFHTLVYPIGPGTWRSDLALPPMAPGSERTYVFDLSAFCDDAAGGGTTIASVAPLVDQSLSLTLVQPASGSKTVTFTLAGGDAAIPGPVLYLDIVLANGDIEQVTITQQIASLSPPIPYPSSPTGSPLTVGFHPIDVSTLAQLPGGAQPGDAVVAVRGGTVGLLPPASGGGGPLEYVFQQSMPSATWAITHNLGRHPVPRIVTTAGDLVEGDVHFADANNLVLTFAAPFAGTAYL